MTESDEEGEPVVALQPLRHVCHACGNCCFGWRVKLVQDDERERIRGFGEALGVERPIEDGGLRFEGGHCVFLEPDRRCRIHAVFGYEAKPTVCRQFPIRLTRTEDHLRLGIDPACTSTHRSWLDGPEIDVGELAPPLERSLGPEATGSMAAEQGLLALLMSPAMTFTRFVRMMIGASGGGADTDTTLPSDFLARLGMRLRAMRLERLIAHPFVGGPVSDLLAPLAARLSREPPSSVELLVHPDLAGPWSPFVLDVMRRQVFLRLGDPELPPEGQALTLAAGAVAIAAYERDFERFAKALSCWARVIRMRAFCIALFPRPATARWVVDGRLPPDDPTPGAPSDEPGTVEIDDAG